MGINIPIGLMTRHELIQEIEAYARDCGIAPATVTSRAVGNSRLYRNLMADGDCTTGVAGRVRAYMAAHPPIHEQKGAA